jgi:hypothetical protein
MAMERIFASIRETGSALGLWRNFAGVAIPVGKRFTLEPGYLNQYVVRNGPDRIDHTANLTLSANF